MSTKIQIRRDTASAWTAANPALANGEIGYETDTRNIKIGDGTTVWTSLKYQAPYYTAANSGAPNTLLALDVTNSRVGIGNSSPASTLDVTGQVRVRGGSSYSEPSENASVINYDSTGGILTVDARSGGGTTNIVFRASTSGTGGERVRIRPSGNVLETNGIVTSNRTTAGTFVVSGDGAYAFGTDTKQYVYGKPGNDGNVAIYTTSAAGVSNDRLNVTSTAVQVKTALTTTSTATIGDALTVSTGGLTVSAGGLTVSAGTVTVPAGSIAGAALVNNGVTFAKLAQVSTPSFLGTPAGTSSATNVSALTQAQSRTMLGLPSNVVGAGSLVGTQNSATQKNASLAVGNWAQFELTYAAATTLGVAGHTWLYLTNRVSSGGSQFACAILAGQQTMADIVTATGFGTGSTWNFCVCRVA